MTLTVRICRPVQLVAIAAGMWCVSLTHAQTLEQQGLRPVEQTVEDMDPTQISLRRENPGLSTIGERQNVFRRIVPDAGPYQPGNQRLYFVSYGVVAEFDRSEYGIVTDNESDLKGGIIQFIPPNTVFHIGLPNAPKPRLDADAFVPGMVQGRVDAMVRGASPYDHAVTGQPIAPSQLLAIDADANDAQRYREMVIAQRGLVMSAIVRVSKTPAP